MLNAAFQKLLDERASRDEARVRSLLEQWVSEIEPAIVYQDNEIVGLCDANAELGSTPFVFRGVK